MPIHCIAINSKKNILEDIRKHILKNPEFQLLQTFDNTIEAFKFVEKNQVDLVLINNTVSMSENFFFADANGKRNRINFKDIVYIESAGNYVLINGLEMKLMIYKSMNAMEQLLNERYFIRIHKSYIVSIDYVEAIRRNECILCLKNEKKIIPIGNTFKQSFFCRLGITSESTGFD
ncbi:MAG TPA: LytTR family DNA-binding domain-containing protein [Bacteroidia bacterium]|jgi:hypothetical protein|nr:LytTR family DNA-binding domain-containing protein [Bacteroidia bacterium]